MAHIKGAMFHLGTQDDVLRHCYPEMHKRQVAGQNAAPPPPPTPAATPKAKAKKKASKAEVEDSERTTLPAPEPATELDPFKEV
jgi:hypothetical protein